MRACRACIASAWILRAAAPCLARRRRRALPTAPRAARAPPPIVYLAEIDGIIHPVATAYIRGAIAAGRRRAAPPSLVIILRTPGGLVDSTRDINTAIIQAKTPVAVFVGAVRAAAPRPPGS